MTATAAQIATIRRMVAEPLTTTYSDTLIQAFIETYPLMDSNGEDPYELDTSTTPPSYDDNANWIPTYDLNAAAADIMDEKAASVAVLFDFSADGGDYKRTGQFEQYSKQARKFRSKRAVGSIQLHKFPKERIPNGWVANLMEPDDLL